MTDGQQTRLDAIEPEGPERIRMKRGPRGRFLDFVSGVPLGIGLLTALFVYASIGSAGIVYPVLGGEGLRWKHDMIRQWRVFELTEFEWFHTWFFVGLCAAICINVALATLLRIPFNALKAGVWMIHTGIIVMAIGSVVYFSTKVEGDAPVVRRQVTIEVPGGEAESMPALPGVSRTVEGEDGAYSFEIVSILPQYELLSGEQKGTTDFAVTVRVEPPDGTPFFRQLLAKHPQYTEDSIEVDPAEHGGRPMQRVRNLPGYDGEPLVRSDLDLGLDYLPQTSFWIKDSWAIHLREVGSEDWIERPIGRLPRYNDYIPAREEIWPTAGRHPIQALDIAVPSRSERDPLAGTPLRIGGYLRYAVEQKRFVAGGDRFNPMLDLRLDTSDGRTSTFQLLALDPVKRTAAEGNLGFFWAESDERFESIIDDAGPARLVFSVPNPDGEPVVVRTRIPEAELEQADQPLKAVGTTGWQYRVQAVANDLEIRPGIASNFAVVEMVSPREERILRYVATDPRETRDIDPGSDPPYVTPDPAISVGYERTRMPSISFVGREGENRELTMIERLRSGSVRQQAVTVGDSVDLGSGNLLRLTRLVPDARSETRPVIVPDRQRDADVDRSHHYAMVKVGLGAEEDWLTFHKYSEMSEPLALAGLTRYEPAVFTAPDGRQIEMMFGRQRRDLPAPVVLEDFILTSHIGGFSGDSSQIRNWTSELRFLPESGEPVREVVSVNNPSEFAGLWYFQSFWDAPRSGGGSAGMAFTGLGIGNREGVWTALFGSCLAVIGMIYTFYVKPIIKRRRRERVLRGLGANTIGAQP